MQILKLAFISILLLFLVATGVSLMIPAHIRISRAINIHSTKEQVLGLITNSEKWKLWHPAFMPANASKNIASIELTRLNENDSSVLYKLKQGNKVPVLNGWQVYNLSPDSLTLQGYMDFRLKWYPWQKFSSLFYENTYGILLQQGLSNIKDILENQP
ncbi:MAG: hypothetical protein ACJ748_07005 [Flavisolibacter sp.]